MNVMFCGASDIKKILPSFINIAKEMGLEVYNFMQGSFRKHNYGVENWKNNSIMNVENADLLVFIIEENFGRITWEIEFERAFGLGKNIIILCFEDTFRLYRDFKDE